MNDIAPDDISWMPSRTAKYLCRQTERLVKGGSLTPDACQRIYSFCGVRPGTAQWRTFLIPVLFSLGLLSLVTGALFFVAWNWADMPKITKFALTELLIVALAAVVWWRWYHRAARSALLAVGLSFGALFALYGQVYQTGADSWELFRAWLCVLLPLALIGRQNSLWFCSWLVANLGFQLYYTTLSLSFVDILSFDIFVHLPTAVLCSYLAALALCLIFREVLALRAIKHHPESWLASRWFSRLMAGFLLLLLTCIVAGNMSGWGRDTPLTLITGFWLITLLAGYYLYRYRYPDLCMLTLGTASLTATGCVLIMQLFDDSYDVGDLFLIGCLMALWVAGNGALLLHWRRKLYERAPVDVAPAELTALTEKLLQHGLLNQTQIQEIQQHDHSSHLPWYLRLALSIGGWVAAMIILLLLALILYMADLLNDPDATTVIIPSLLLAAIAGGLLRTQGAGKHHIGLAWAIAATCGLCVGVFMLVEPDGETFILVSSLCALPVLAVMAMVMPDRTYRFMAITVMTLLVILSGHSLTSLYLPPVSGLCVISALVACVMIFWLWIVRNQLNLQTDPFAEAVHPLMHGIPAGLILLCFLGINAEFISDIFWYTPQFSTLQLGLGGGIAAGLTFSALYQRVVEKTHLSLFTLPAAILCGAAAVYAPGMGLGLWLLLMARYQGSQGILLVSGGFIMLYVSGWYYFLGVTLLHKSLLLLVSGLVLLVLTWVVKKFLPAHSGGAYENQ